MIARQLDLFPEAMGICCLEAGRPIPAWSTNTGFFSVTGTPEELSVVCPEASIPEGTVCSRGWRLFRVKGPLDFSETGVLASLAEPLARARISIFVVSAYDTDMLLVLDDVFRRLPDPFAGAGKCRYDPRKFIHGM